MWDPKNKTYVYSKTETDSADIENKLVVTSRAKGSGEGKDRGRYKLLCIK